MKYHRGHRRSHGRVDLGRGVDFEWDLTGVPLPRVKLWPDDRGMLIGISVGDKTSDPIVGVDIHLLGRVGRPPPETAMTVYRDGITLRVRRRPPSCLATEIARARDELLTRAARAKALDLADRPIAAAAMRGKAVAYREAVDLLVAALTRADS